MSSVHEVSGGCIRVAWVAGGYERVSLVRVLFLEKELVCDFFKVSIKSLALFFVQFGSALDFSLHLDGLLPKILSHEWRVVVVLTIRASSVVRNGSDGLIRTSWLLLRGFHSINECLFGSDRTFGRR